MGQPGGGTADTLDSNTVGAVDEQLSLILHISASTATTRPVYPETGDPAGGRLPVVVVVVVSPQARAIYHYYTLEL